MPSPPDYTTGKLTLAEGYEPPRNHPFWSDIRRVSIGTDPGLALNTRKGTGSTRYVRCGLVVPAASPARRLDRDPRRVFDEARLSPDTTERAGVRRA